MILCASGFLNLDQIAPKLWIFEVTFYYTQDPNEYICAASKAPPSIMVRHFLVF